MKIYAVVIFATLFCFALGQYFGTGVYTYIDTNGVNHKVSYEEDQNGIRITSSNVSPELEQKIIEAIKNNKYNIPSYSQFYPFQYFPSRLSAQAPLSANRWVNPYSPFVSPFIPTFPAYNIFGRFCLWYINRKGLQKSKAQKTINKKRHTPNVESTVLLN